MTQPQICATCGHVGRPVYVKRGTVLISIVLWLTFIIPGIIYSLWRLTSGYRKCEACGSTSLLPLNTQAGRKLVTEQGKTIEQAIADVPPPEGPTKVPAWVGWTVVVVAALILLIIAMTFYA